MIRYWHIIILIFIIVFSVIYCTPRNSYAGNPLYMNPDGLPLIWDTTHPIKYKIDPKGLGSLNMTESAALIAYAFSVWESVTHTNLSFEFDGFVEEEITIDNWEQLAGNHIYSEANGITTNTTEAQKNHIIIIGFDNTGEILAAKGSTNASGAQSITGVSGTYENPEHIISAHVFLNGLFYNNNDTDVEDISLLDLTAITIHEMGHALGMDHSLLNNQMYQDILSGELDTSYARYLPTMFPRFIKGTGAHLISLHPDDIATMQWLYGNNDLIGISGEVLDSALFPVETMNITARHKTSPLCHAYTQVTGVLCETLNTEADGSGSAYFSGKTCLNADKVGYYALPILKTGEYTLDVNDIPDYLENSITRFDDAPFQNTDSAGFYYNPNETSSAETKPYTTLTVENTANDNIDLIFSQTISSSTTADFIDYTVFENDDFFGQASDTDIYCPLEADITEELLLAYLNDFVLEMPQGSTSQPLNLTSPGCSLNTAQTTSINLTGFFFLLCGLVMIGLRSLALSLKP